MKTKKLTSTILTAALLLTLTACGETPDSGSGSTAAESTSAAQTAADSEMASQNTLPPAEPTAETASQDTETTAETSLQVAEPTASADTALSETEAKTVEENTVSEALIFESTPLNGKKLTLLFAASTNGHPAYALDKAIVNATDENGKVLQSSALNIPKDIDASFADSNIPIRLISCGDGASDLGLIGIPGEDGTYFAAVYVSRALRLSQVNGLFPKVSSLDDIKIHGNIISCNDISEGADVSYAVDLGACTSEKLPNVSGALGLEELAPENGATAELTVHAYTFTLPEDAAPGCPFYPVEYNGAIYKYNFTYCNFIADKDKNIIDLEAFEDWKLNPEENRLDAILEKFGDMEYVGRAEKTDLGNYTLEEANVYRYGDDLILIYCDPSFPLYSWEFRKNFYGIFDIDENSSIGNDSDKLGDFLAERGMDYDPNVFMCAMLYEKSE